MQNWQEFEKHLKPWAESVRQDLAEAKDFGELEETILRRMQELARRLLAVSLQERDERIRSERWLCPECSGETISKGSSPRQIETVVGTMPFQRWRKKCKACGANFFPSG